MEIKNAYAADYRISPSRKAKFWVSESAGNEEAVLLLNAMNSRVGKTGMFSDSTPLNVDGITVYFVAGQPQPGLYHYFYAEDKFLWKFFALLFSLIP